MVFFKHKDDDLTCNEITPNHRQINFGYSVLSLSDLPIAVADKTLYYVEEEKDFYIYHNGEWNTYCAGIITGLNSEQKMKIEQSYSLYSSKKEPEKIGEREYTNPTIYYNVPIIFGVFGVEVEIGTRSSYSQQIFYAKEEENQDNRIEVNISNFVHFIVEKYEREFGIYSRGKQRIYNYAGYSIFIDSYCIYVKEKSGIFGWKEILYVKWDTNYNNNISNKVLTDYRFDDKNIPIMKVIVENMLFDIKEHSKKAAEDAEAKKIYYQMLGI